MAVFTGSVVNSTLRRLSASGGSGVRVIEVNGTLPVEPPCGKSAGQSLKACPSAFALASATTVKRSIIKTVFVCIRLFGVTCSPGLDDYLFVELLIGSYSFTFRKKKQEQEPACCATDGPQANYKSCTLDSYF
jgi:hypothetical protein